jgi:hypothetical protein
MSDGRLDFCIKEFLRLRSESIDPCDESFVAADEKEALLADEKEALLADEKEALFDDSDDEIELLLMDDLSLLFPSANVFDIVSATLRSLFFRVDISR